MNAADEAPVLVVRRQMAVPRERVFEAWLDAETMAHWMRPEDSTHATVIVDPRVGGGFRIVMEGPTHGAVEHRGEYLAIEPPSLLSFTWISRSTDHQPTIVTIEFHERGTGTEYSPIGACRRRPSRGIGGGGPTSCACCTRN